MMMKGPATVKSATTPSATHPTSALPANDALAAAPTIRDYIDREFRLLPVHVPTADGGCSCARPACSTPGKHPLQTAWHERASLDPAEVATWWSRHNVGVALGAPSRYIVIDPDGAEGVANWEALCAPHGGVPLTLSAISGSGVGRHYWFRIPADRKFPKRLGTGGHGIAPHVDVLADGCQVLVAPSRHKSGGTYRWVEWATPIIDLPVWLDRIIAGRPAVGRAVADQQAAGGAAAGRTTADPRQLSPMAAAAERLMVKAVKDIRAIPADTASRHVAINAIAYKCARACALYIEPGVDDLGHQVDPLATGTIYARLRAATADLLHVAPLPEERADDDVGRAVRDGADDAEAAEKARPSIHVGQPLHELGLACVAVLAAASDIYAMGRQYVRLVTSSDGQVSTVRVDDDALKFVLSEGATFVSAGRNGPVNVHPTKDAVSGVRGATDTGAVRQLRSIALAPYPVLDATGRIVRWVTEPGYDAESQVYLACSGIVAPPSNPTEAQIAAAVAALRVPLRDFPFVGGSESAAIAAMMTDLILPAIEGNAPLNVVTSSVGGSGKGKLVSVISIITTGGDTSITLLPRSDEEFEKRLTTWALEGRRRISVDNADGPLANAGLEAALTSRTYGGRLLGKSKGPIVHLGMSWSITGVNISLCGNLPRRSLWIRLVPRTESPELREGLPDVLAYARAHRSELLSALLVLLAAGSHHTGPLSTWGSYEQWSHLVRRALLAAGLVDPMASRSDLQTDDARACDAALLDAIADVYPDRFTAEDPPWTAADLLASASRLGETMPLGKALGAVLRVRAGESPTATHVGIALRDLRDRMILNLTLSCAGKTRTGAALWKITEHLVTPAPREKWRADLAQELSRPNTSDDLQPPSPNR